MFDFFVANVVVVVEALRADSDDEVVKFLFSEVDLDCAEFGLFNAGSEGLCLILLILQEYDNCINAMQTMRGTFYLGANARYSLYRIIAFVTLFSIPTTTLSL